MKLGNDLKKFREKRGRISQEALANAVGVSRQTIISIEKGKFIPSAFLAIKIAKYFDSNVEEIFYLIDDQNNKIRWRVKWK
ncbi:MAG: helix-turn-helix transcriptional regulator [Melioribacteraceae bacterium]|nr:helix-turn-helix transcriptional regulator [Melioribacteraceae bacterium]